MRDDVDGGSNRRSRARLALRRLVRSRGNEDEHGPPQAPAAEPASAETPAAETPAVGDVGAAATPEVSQLEMQISELTASLAGGFKDAQTVYAVQDLLFRRFRAKYVGRALSAGYLSDESTDAKATAARRPHLTTQP